MYLSYNTLLTSQLSLSLSLSFFSVISISSDEEEDPVPSSKPKEAETQETDLNHQELPEEVFDIEDNDEDQEDEEEVQFAQMRREPAARKATEQDEVNKQIETIFFGRQHSTRRSSKRLDLNGDYEEEDYIDQDNLIDDDYLEEGLEDLESELEEPPEPGNLEEGYDKLDYFDVEDEETDDEAKNGTAHKTNIQTYYQIVNLRCPESECFRKRNQAFRDVKLLNQHFLSVHGFRLCRCLAPGCKQSFSNR